MATDKNPHDNGHGNDGGHGEPNLVHFVVDGEPETTDQKTLTAAQIIALTGLESATNYLEETAPEKKSFKDNSEASVEMKNGMVFKTKPIGPMPVS